MALPNTTQMRELRHAHVYRSVLWYLLNNASKTHDSNNNILQHVKTPCKKRYAREIEHASKAGFRSKFFRMITERKTRSCSNFGTFNFARTNIGRFVSKNIASTPLLCEHSGVSAKFGVLDLARCCNEILPRGHAKTVSRHVFRLY